jgi:hypothetical protein
LDLHLGSVTILGNGDRRRWYARGERPMSTMSIDCYLERDGANRLHMTFMPRFSASHRPTLSNNHPSYPMIAPPLSQGV